MTKDNYFSVSVNIYFSSYKVILHISKMLMLKFQLVIIWRPSLFLFWQFYHFSLHIGFRHTCFSMPQCNILCMHSVWDLHSFLKCSLIFFLSVDNSQSFHKYSRPFLIWGLQWHIYSPLLLKSPCRSRCWDTPSILSHSVLQFSIFIDLIF